MKKQLFALMLVAASIGLPAAAYASGDTIVSVSRPDRVTLTETSKSVNVEIRGKEGDKSFRFNYSKSLGEDAMETMVQRADSWDFSLPIIKGKKKKGSTHYVGVGGIGFGFVSALGAPRDVDVDMAASYEIFATLLSLNRRFVGKHEFSVGIGLDWKNYRMTGNRRFLKEGGHIRVDNYPEGADVDFSRLKIFSLTFPFQYTYSFAKNWNVSAAAILNLNTYGSLKTRYTVEGKDAKDFQKKIHQKPTSVDFMGSISWHGFGLYVKYAPFNVLQTDLGPSFSGISTGFVVGF